MWDQNSVSRTNAAEVMESKQYQKRSLNWLRHCCQKCRMMQEDGGVFPASTAFMAVTGGSHEGRGRPYAPV